MMRKEENQIDHPVQAIAIRRIPVQVHLVQHLVKTLEENTVIEIEV